MQTVHEIGARTKADLTHVTEHRSEIASLKGRVDELLSRIDETEERISSIDARRRVVDEVHSKTTAVVHMLDDVRIDLETLGEHKAVIDHVAERVQQLEFTLQDARALANAPARTRSWPGASKGIRQLRATGRRRAADGERQVGRWASSPTGLTRLGDRSRCVPRAV